MIWPIYISCIVHAFTVIFPNTGPSSIMFNYWCSNETNSPLRVISVSVKLTVISQCKKHKEIKLNYLKMFPGHKSGKPIIY